MGQPAAAPPQPARRRKRRLLVLVVVIAHALGFATSIQALLTTRTSQGAIAWIVSLNTLPYVSVPAYWVFGRSKFQGYVVGRSQEDSEIGALLVPKIAAARALEVELPRERRGIEALERLADVPFLGGNRVELLVDGERTFESLLAGIEGARRYVLVQFYIVRDDELGRRLAELLERKAREGVRVHLLYDEFGSRKLGKEFVRSLSAAGVAVRHFHSTRGRGNRLQVNFRNHRKIVVVDGERGWVGGFNVGSEYLGAWRDTHMGIEGPAVLGLQVSFLEDWNWAAEELLELDWTPRRALEGDTPVLILASGPADRFETASLMVQEALHAARERVWISSPYFVPDEAVLGALKLAALRGVDVRILLPERTNDSLVRHAQFAFLDPLLEAGVSIRRYSRGFLHQKALLIDDDLVGIGTVNLDNRSLRLNFEVTALVYDRVFATEVAAMLEADFEGTSALTRVELAERGWLERALSRAAYLFAPVL